MLSCPILSLGYVFERTLVVLSAYFYLLSTRCILKSEYDIIVVLIKKRRIVIKWLFFVFFIKIMAGSCSTMTDEPRRFVFYKARFTLHEKMKTDSGFVDGLYHSYAEYLSRLIDGVIGYGRFFLPGRGVRQYATGHFVFLVNEFRDQDQILESLKEISESLSVGPNHFVHEIPESQFIEEIALCGRGTASAGWKCVKKEKFGPKDEINWPLFLQRMGYLKECVFRYSR